MNEGCKIGDIRVGELLVCRSSTKIGSKPTSSGEVYNIAFERARLASSCGVSLRSAQALEHFAGSVLSAGYAIRAV